MLPKSINIGVLIIALAAAAPTATGGGQSIKMVRTPLDDLKLADIPAAERFAWQPKEVVAVLGSHAWHYWPNPYLHYEPVTKLITDGKKVQVLSTDVIPQGEWFRLFDADTFRDRLTFQLKQSTGAGVSPNDKFVALVHAKEFDWTATVWETKTKKKYATLQGRGEGPTYLFLSPGGKFAAAYMENARHVFDVATGQPLFPLPNYISYPTFHPTQPIVYYAHTTYGSDAGDYLSRTGLIHEINLQTRQDRVLVQRKAAQSEPMSRTASLVISPDGLFLAYRLWHHDKRTKSFNVWDVKKRKLAYAIPDLAVNDAAFSPDGRTLALALPQGQIRLLNRGTGKEIATIGPKDQALPMNRLTFSPAGKFLAATVPPLSAIQLWDIGANKPLHPDTEFTKIHAVSPDGKSLLLTTDRSLLLSGERGLVLHDVATGKRRAVPLPYNWIGVYGAAFYDNGRRVFLSGYTTQNHKMASFDATSADFKSTEAPYVDEFSRFILTPDERTLITSLTTNPSVRSAYVIWDTATWKPRRTVRGAGNDNFGMAVSPDSKLLYASTTDGIRIIDLESAEIKTLIPGEPLGMLCMSPDGTKLALLHSGAKEFRVLSTKDGSEIYHCKGHTCAITQVLFDETGTTLLTCGQDGRVFRWYNPTSKSEIKLPGPVIGMVPSVDGRHLFLNAGNGTVYVLRLEVVAREQ